MDPNCHKFLAAKQKDLCYCIVSKCMFEEEPFHMEPVRE